MPLSHAIIWLAAAHAAAGQSPPDFSKDVAPIVFAHCSPCHHAGGSAPFSLMSYDDVRKRARQVALVTQQRIMPPWLAKPTTTGGGYFNERGLLPQQINTIQDWVQSGAVEGDPAALPKPPVFVAGWRRGEPDLVLTLAESYTLAADGSDVLRTFVLPTNLEIDRAVEAIELRPGNDRAVHHAAFLVDVSGNARMLDRADAPPGYAAMGDIGLNRTGSFGSWSPSAPVFELPPGFAMKLPAGADVVVEMHFNPTGKAETIHPQVGLYFSKAPARKVMAVTLGSFLIDIPAGASSHRIADAFTLPVSGEVIAISPHAHYVCQKVSVRALPPDATPIELLTIDDWDFNWQQPFRFRNPVRFEAGTTIEVELIYDNSDANPQNPSNPPQHVRSGMRRTDEMAIVIVHIAVDSVADAERLQTADREHQLNSMKK